MKTKRSKEEVKAYYKRLREQWAAAKETADVDHISAIIKTHGMNISVWGYAFVAYQMKAKGLDGLPYLDMKTFQGWKENGFMVRKGEKSTAIGLTWVPIGGEKEDGEEIDAYKIPRTYHLFHKSQVDAI